MKTLLTLILVVLTVCYAAEIHEEIHNGYTARPGQFPYQALLLLLEKSGNVNVCGGSLISKNYVLTAAHCTFDSSIYQVNVSLGVTNSLDANGVLTYAVPRSDILNHPEYDDNTMENDICILPLPSSVKLSSQINTIALPRQSWAGPDTFLGKKVTVSGFGRTYTEEMHLHPLMYTILDILPRKNCKRYYEDRPQYPRVEDGMTCTAVGPRSTRPCKGDSGGPLTVKLSSGLYLIGAVSWGDQLCGDSTDPTVYTDVAYFLPWINEVTGIPIN